MTNTGSGTNEEQALNTALEEATPLLAESLQRAERDHRRKRRLLLGGLVMLVLGASIVASLVITAGEPPTKDEQAQGSTTVSIEQFEEVVETEALGQRGWQLWSERNYGEAAKQFVEAIKADPESPNLWNGLGWSLFHTGQREKAADAFKQCHVLDEHWLGAINGLGQIAYAQRDYEQAKAWFLKATNAPASQHTLVSVYLLTGEYEQAERLASKLLQGFPENSDDVSITTQRMWLVELHAAAKAETIPDALRQKIEPVKPVKSKNKVDAKPATRPKGTNLLTNGGFERGAEGWIIGNNSNRIAELRPDTESKTEGKQSLKITKTGGVPIDIIRINAPKIVPGQTVEVSAAIKADQVGNAWMKFFVWDGDGNALIEDLDVTRIHDTHDWRTVSKEFVIPEGTQNAAIQFWMIMDGTMWIDDVRIESVEPEAPTAE